MSLWYRLLPLVERQGLFGCHSAKVGLRKPGDMLILLTHYPAYAPPVAKNQEGTFTTLRELAGSIKPVLIIQGHIHQWAGSQYDVLLDSKRVLVANPGGFGMAVSVDPAKGSVSIAGQPGGRAGH